ncbi:hypothetical protein TIFTF001_032739 [Ficus carica]|uniref:Multipolar spindle 1 n=1 Tax=Ficus carica TaxID=3494 RepID=A0AA88E3U9_FICCA|nr:hypothetical protein TIFTF001_032650 [Ficus carica]GMN63647.1 hypothetical protein TIFTF001_032739 [Ficus carica]
MTIGNGAEPASSGRDEQTVKLALAISLLRSKLLQNPRPPPLPNNPSDSDVLRWKRKAKERKQELLRLREDLKQSEDVSQCDLFPQSAACKCYFFDRLGKLSPKAVADGSDRRFDDVLRRRFLRQDLCNEDELEQLRASVAFLVELCDTVSPVEEVNFANWSHQAVDFILGSQSVLFFPFCFRRAGLLLVLMLCFTLPGSNHNNVDPQFYVQHLIRKLGKEAFIGQRAILSVSQRVSLLAESLLVTDPFDVSFPRMNQCMFTMIQLIEFLISDYLSIWSKDQGFDRVLLEEWVTSIFHARKALELMESRNGLYVLYVDRVTGLLGKQVSQVSSLQKIKPDILDKLLC